jgi:peptide/nickel transport system substrate-binding protein
MILRGESIRLLGWALALTGCVVSGESVERSRLSTASECSCDDSSGLPRDVFETPRPPRTGGTVDIRISREPASLISLIEGDPVVSNIIDHTVLEPLVRVSEDGQTVEPELADRFEIDKEGRQYTFYLDEEARWHDGHPVTASDVHFVFSKLLDPYSSLAVSASFANIKAIHTPDESTIVFELDRFLPHFLFTIATVPILPAHIFGRTPIALHEAARAPIGSGPFRFVRWIPSRLIELERNPDWRGKPPYVDQLVYHIIPDDRIAIDMLNHGDLDIVPNLPASGNFSRANGAAFTYPLPFVEAWTYNLSHPFLVEPTSRQALAMLIDKETIRCAILRCRADLPEMLFSGASEQERVLPTLSFNPKEAKQLLKTVGWRDVDGDGILERDGMRFSFSLLLPNSGRDQERAAAVIQEDMASAGIEMRISTVSRGAFFGRLFASRFDVAVVSVRISGHFDAWSLFHTARGVTANFGGFSNPGVDALLDRLQFETDSTMRINLLDTLRRRLIQRQPLTFTFRPYATAVARFHLGGVTFRDGWIDVSALFIEERSP